MKMSAKNVLIGCLGLLLYASSGASSDRNPSNECGVIQVTAPGVPAAAKRRVKKLPTFSASSVLDLKIETALSPALKGPHQVEFRLFTPNGHLYQALPATVTAPAPATDRRNRDVARQQMASAMFPVAGTTIVSSSLYGEWKVEAFLDGERTVACTKPISFVIDP
jgi:hypothetical protein